MLARVADAKASLQLSVSAVVEVAHAAEWNCTIELDALDQQLRTDIAALQRSLTKQMESQQAAMSEMRVQIENDLADVKRESETLMTQKIIPLETALAATETLFDTRLNEQSMAQKQMSMDADVAINELDTRLKDAFLHLQKTLRDLDQHYTTEAFLVEAALKAHSEELASSKRMIGGQMKCTSRALHLLQKLMCRPDGAQLFLEFDTDGDGTVSREELKEGYAKIGEHLSEEDMDAIMALVDQDGDGAIGYGEFVQMGKMTEDVEALRMTMQANLAQLKAESEETMVQKIIPLEESLATTRKDLEHTMSHTIAEIENTIEDISTDLNAQMETLRFDMHGTTPYRAYLLRFVSSC